MNFKYVEKRVSFITQNIPSVLEYFGQDTPTKYKICVLSDDLIGRSFAITGAYEEAGIAAVKWLCKNGYILDALNSTFVDIGANIGTYSLQLSDQFKSVLAFEPHPVVNKVLDLNKTINNLDNLLIEPYGLSNVDAEAKLYEPTKNIGGSSLEHQGSGSSYTVKIKHASTAINQLKNSKVSFIKMDVEGHELIVMQGLKELLIKDRPVVAFEANDLDRNEELLGYMKSVGYGKFLALDTKPSIKNPILRMLLLLLFGARYQLKPVKHFGDQKYSLVFAFSNN